MSDHTPERSKKPNQTAPDDAEKQKQRKRALDRKAQRASREKTKSHIAHLEHIVEILGAKNGDSSTIAELMEENTRLRAEIERLKKIIDNIKSLLGVEVLEATLPRLASRFRY
jgi:hypothetical protein